MHTRQLSTSHALTEAEPACKKVGVCVGPVPIQNCLSVFGKIPYERLASFRGRRSAEL